MPKESKIKMSSNKSFGIVFFLFFLIISLWPLINYQEIRIWAIVVSLFFLIFGLLNSKILTPLNTLWFKFGLALGSIIAPIVMGLVYFIVVTPTGLLMRIFKKDVLNTKFEKNKKTYWVKKNNLNSSMKKQF